MGLFDYFQKKKISDEEAIRLMIYEIEDDLTKEERKFEVEKLEEEKASFSKFWTQGGKNSEGALILRKETEINLAKRVSRRLQKSEEKEKFENKVNDLTAKIAWKIWKQSKGKCLLCGTREAINIQRNSPLPQIEEEAPHENAGSEGEKKEHVECEKKEHIECEKKESEIFKVGEPLFKHMAEIYKFVCPSCAKQSVI